MPLNIKDAEEAWLGSVDFDEFLAEFEGEWYEPLTEMLMAGLWEMLPEEIRVKLKEVPNGTDQVR